MLTKAHVIQYPSGRFGFVGSVPVSLAYVYEDEADVLVAQQSGPGIARKIAARHGRVFKTRTWDSEADALQAARNIEERA